MNSRLANIDDFDLVIELMEDVFKDISEETIGLYKMSYLKALESNNIEQFLFSENDEVTGHVTLTLYHSFYDKGNIMWIDDLTVRQDKRRKGCGTKIMEFCLKYANQHNVVEVFVGADNDNLEAQKLYEKFLPRTSDIIYIKKLREHGL
jgi:predicted acetyltransferase